MIECAPTASAFAVYVASPDAIVPVPSVVVPSLNVTVPVGKAPVTVAMKVVEPPTKIGSALAANVVVEVILLTVWVIAEEVLAALSASPAYTAVMVCEAAVNDDVVNVATPVARVPVPNVVAPSLKVTVPVGPLPVTLAVKVTAPLTKEGFALEVTTVVGADFTV